mmetsp:Transcript_36627/g.59212  ORF Transcript_36627/g.59212 Transcript_36627/m.59212 type:complete len:223 (-) Transcript_36627:186-854(-)
MTPPCFVVVPAVLSLRIDEVAVRSTRARLSTTARRSAPNRPLWSAIDVCMEFAPCERRKFIAKSLALLLGTFSLSNTKQALALTLEDSFRQDSLDRLTGKVLFVRDARDTVERIVQVLLEKDDIRAANKVVASFMKDVRDRMREVIRERDLLSPEQRKEAENLSNDKSDLYQYSLSFLDETYLDKPDKEKLQDLAHSIAEETQKFLDLVPARAGGSFLPSTL